MKKIDSMDSSTWEQSKEDIVDVNPAVVRISDTPIDGQYGAVKYSSTVLKPVIGGKRMRFSPDFENASVSNGRLVLNGVSVGASMVRYDASTGTLIFGDAVSE